MQDADTSSSRNTTDHPQRANEGGLSVKVHQALAWFLGLFLTVALLTTPNVSLAVPTRSLILYDSNPTYPYNKLGQAYAIMLRNLLGHFATQVDFLPIENYTPGAI